MAEANVDETGAGANVQGAGAMSGATQASSGAETVTDTGQAESFVAANLDGTRSWNINSKLLYDRTFLQSYHDHQIYARQQAELFEDSRRHIRELQNLALTTLKNAEGESNRDNNSTSLKQTYFQDKMANINETDQLAAKTAVQQDVTASALIGKLIDGLTELQGELAKKAA